VRIIVVVVVVVFILRCVCMYAYRLRAAEEQCERDRSLICDQQQHICHLETTNARLTAALSNTDRKSGGGGVGGGGGGGTRLSDVRSTAENKQCSLH